MRQSRVTTQHIVGLYTDKHLTLQQIGDQIGMTRMAVWKRLKRAGVEREQGTWVNVNCAFCGALIRKRRAQWRKNDKSYCRPACYHASLESPGYRPWRQGQRLARALIEQYYRIPEGALVHHKDGDDRNNNLNNLQVLASQADHLKVHRARGAGVSPLWDGASLG